MWLKSVSLLLEKKFYKGNRKNPDDVLKYLLYGTVEYNYCQLTWT